MASNVGASSNLTEGSPDAAPAAKVPPKNAPGNKSDIAWQYAISIDEKTRRVMCKLCKHEYSGSVYRIKHHLAGTNRNVKPCTKCPPDLRKQMLDICQWLTNREFEKDTY
jgi:RNase P subunit RPR2